MTKGAIWDAVRLTAEKQIEKHNTRLEQGEDAKSQSERSESRSLMQAVAGVALAYHGDLQRGLQSLSGSRHMSSFTHSEDPGSLGNMLVANVKQFVAEHNSKGRRTDADQDAMDVVAALTVGINKGATQLGFNRTMREHSLRLLPQSSRHTTLERRGRGSWLPSSSDDRRVVPLGPD